MPQGGIEVKKIDRTGEERINNQGLKMKIIKYVNRRDIDVEFEDGSIRTYTLKVNKPKLVKSNELNQWGKAHYIELSLFGGIHED